jgi:hypothetical protein
MGSKSDGPEGRSAQKVPDPFFRRRDKGPEDLSTLAVRNAPPWLISAIFHMTALILLGLMFLPLRPSGQVGLEVLTYAEQIGDQLEFDSPLAGTDRDQAEEPILTPDNLPEVEDPFAAPSELDIHLDGHTATSDIPSTQIGLALTGRSEGMKKSLLGRYGGTGTTESAVQLGLGWLARNQNRKDGSWSLTGPYGNGVSDDYENRVVATAMALLAFQGNGHTHRRGEYKKTVSRGWNWLLKEQDADGTFYHDGPFHHRFYTQGICTIALCELYGMSKDAKFREPAERAVRYCLDSQGSMGGWRYSPRVDSDVSVTGWIVMALQSAKMAGLDVPKSNLYRVERFLDRVGLENGTRYPYQRGRMPSLAMTAEALLCRQYLGWSRTDERLVNGADYITEDGNLIDYHRNRNAYYWYYATQVAHHMEGEHWKRWNKVMRQVVPEQQIKKGRERGSWDPRRPTHDQWTAHGGRFYVTCLSIYMLEVYYRHLPIYTKIYPTYTMPDRP